MSKLVPIACLALLGTAGYAAAAPSETGRDSPQASSARAGQQATRSCGFSANKLDPRVVDSARSVDTGLVTPGAATATRTYTTLGIRYEMKM